MSQEFKNPPILVVDDDRDDQEMIEKAFKKIKVSRPVRSFFDGEELLDYLGRKGKYSDPLDSPRPCLILLDLNMPKMGGREVLAMIKTDPSVRNIPVIILTTSKAQEDVLKSYDQGANSFITKPENFEGLTKMATDLQRYWLETVELPG
jgi:CheY-like chemotaxis protein